MYFTRRFYLFVAATACITATGYAWPPLYTVGKGLLWLLFIATLTDIVLLWHRRAVTGRREVGERFSNGDDNRVCIALASHYSFPTRLEVVDEAPFVFQRRDISYTARCKAHGTATIDYTLRPTQRGVYSFGLVRVFATTPIGLVERRYTIGSPVDVKVYPSYVHLNHYMLLAMAGGRENGSKRIRRVGHHTDFEQIKDYVVGDEYRTINWRATARRHQLMVNVYQEERSWPVVCIIDKGRLMQQAHQGLTLLDYAINATLVLSHIAIAKEDRVGLATFSTRLDTYVPPSRQSGQMHRLLEALYAEQSVFSESDFSALVASLGQRLSRRTMLILFTSFVGLTSLHRQLPFLRQLAKRHLLLVVFFEDMELRDYIASPPTSTEDSYQHVIAEKFAYEQRLTRETLRQAGIHVLLTPPAKLTAAVTRRYVDLRS